MSNRNLPQGDPKRAIGAILGIMAVGLFVAAALAKRSGRKDQEPEDCGNEGGVLEGATPPEGAIGEFKMPEDMRAVIPEPPSYAPA